MVDLGRWPLHRVSTFASDLYAADTNGSEDIALWDAVTGAIERIDVTSAGGQVVESYPLDVSVCDDGSRVAWSADATGLVPGDQSATFDVYVRDRTLSTTIRVSEAASGTGGNAHAYDARLSGDCATVAFTSAATNLGTAVPTGITQVWARRLANAGPPELVSADRRGVPGDQSSDSPFLSADGSEILFQSRARNWRVDGGARGFPNVYSSNRNDAQFLRDGFED